MLSKQTRKTFVAIWWRGIARNRAGFLRHRYPCHYGPAEHPRRDVCRFEGLRRLSRGTRSRFQNRRPFEADGEGQECGKRRLRILPRPRQPPRELRRRIAHDRQSSQRSRNLLPVPLGNPFEISAPLPPCCHGRPSELRRLPQPAQGIDDQRRRLNEYHEQK